MSTIRKYGRPVNWCPVCGSSGLHKNTRPGCRHRLAGLVNIMLHNVAVNKCPRCGRSAPDVVDVAGLKRAVARAIVGKRQRLLPAEIRFLRKQLGLSGLDLAMHLGATPESVSRWEHGRTPMGVTADRLLRLMVVLADGTAYPLRSLRTMALDRPKTIPIHVRRHDDRWDLCFGGVPA